MRLITVIAFISFALSIISCNDSTPSAATPGAKGNEGPTISLDGRELESPDITVQVEGFAGGGQVNLIGIFTEQYYKADSAQLDANGVVQFKRNEPYKPGFFYVMYPDGQTNIQVLIDQDQTFTLKTRTGDLIENMQVEGSLDNQLLYETMKFENSQRNEFSNIRSRKAAARVGTPEYEKAEAAEEQLLAERKAYLDKVFSENPNTLFTSFKKAGQNPDLTKIKNPDGSIDTAGYLYKYRTLFWEGVNFNDERLLYTPVIINKLKRYITELTGQNPDSIKASASFLVDKVLNNPEYYKFFANWITLQYEPTKTTLMDSEAVFVHMIQNYFTYDRAFWSDSVEVHGLQLRAYEMSNSLVGQKGPDIKAKDINGQMRSIYEMKSPYIIVYMWNPECEHCAEETPQLVRFYQQWKNRGVDVYGIAINTEDAAYRKAVRSYGMPWVNVFDPTNKSIYATYFVDNTPEIYVLDPDRNIIAKNLKADQLKTVLERDMRKRGMM